MSLPRLRTLLADLDRGTYGHRVRTLARLGRDHADDPGLDRLLTDLAATSEHHHALALVAWRAAGDDRPVLALRTDPSPRLRARAIAALGGPRTTVDEARAVVLEGSADDRRRGRQALLRGRRVDLATELVDEVRARFGDGEAAGLLAGTDAATVRRLLPELRPALRSIAALARRHPEVLLDHLATELDDRPVRQRDRTWAEVRNALPALALADPAGLLDLVERSGPSSVVPEGLEPVLGSLIRHHPGRLAPLLADPRFVRRLGRRLPAYLRRNAHRFAPEDQHALAAALWSADRLFFELLEALPPHRRAGVFAAALAGTDTSARVWRPEELAVLPRDLRHAEARRILALPAVAASEELTRRTRALLPYDEASPLLLAELRRPQAEDRAEGYRLLVAAARHERTPEALADALAHTRRLANEQEPVRLAAADALAAVPAPRLLAEHLDDVAALVRTVVEARDSSATSRARLTKVAFALLVEAAGEQDVDRLGRALALLDELAGPTGHLSFPHLEPLLPPEAAHLLVAALVPRFRRDAATGRYRHALALARALGRKAWDQAELQALVADATRAKADDIVREAVRLWLADPATRADRVGRVLSQDPSTIVLHDVFDAVRRTRQDLLDVLFRSRPPRGRFLAGDVRHVPVVHTGFDRWLPRQLAAYAQALDQLIATSATPTWTRASAVQALALLPGIGRAALAPHLASPEVPVQEAALAGLAWTDRPAEALVDLLSLADGDRARVAVYAATRAARFAAPADVLAALCAVLDRPDAKVTARKEAVRLLAATRPPEAIDVLVHLGGRPDLHRDVLAAVGRSLRVALDDDRSWAVLDRVAAGADDLAASLLETRPEQLAPRHRGRWAALVLGLAGSGGPELRRDAVVALDGWNRWSPAVAGVLAATVADLDRSAPWRPAVAVLRGVLEEDAGWTQLADLVATLAAGDGPEVDAAATRDLPARQRLDLLVGLLVGLPAEVRTGHRADLRALADLLGAAPLGTLDAVRLRLATLTFDEAGPELVAVADGLDRTPLLVAAAATELARRHQVDRDRWSGPHLAAAVDALLAHGAPAPAPAAAVLALALIEEAGERFGWPEGWRARLRTLRAAPDPTVALLARSVTTAAE